MKEVAPVEREAYLPSRLRADGREIGPGMYAVGDVFWHAPSRQWRCLADVRGALCLVEVRIVPSTDDRTDMKTAG